MTVLERLEQLRTEATPGEWHEEPGAVTAQLMGEYSSSVASYVIHENAALIVAAVNALPALLRIARALSAFSHELRVGGNIGSAIESMESRDWEELRSALSDLEANT